MEVSTYIGKITIYVARPRINLAVRQELYSASDDGIVHDENLTI